MLVFVRTCRHVSVVQRGSFVPLPRTYRVVDASEVDEEIMDPPLVVRGQVYPFTSRRLGFVSTHVPPEEVLDSVVGLVDQPEDARSLAIQVISPCFFVEVKLKDHGLHPLARVVFGALGRHPEFLQLTASRCRRAGQEIPSFQFPDPLVLGASLGIIPCGFVPGISPVDDAEELGALVKLVQQLVDYGLVRFSFPLGRSCGDCLLDGDVQRSAAASIDESEELRIGVRDTVDRRIVDGSGGQVERIPSSIVRHRELVLVVEILPEALIKILVDGSLK